MARNRFNPQQKGGGKFKAPEVSAPNPDTLKPKFCLALMRGAGCVSACTTDEQAAFADTLRRLSQLTWSQLRQADRHGLGYEKINRSGIRVAFPPSVTEDVNIIAFRFCGMAPMLCYRDREVLHILWLDRDFTAYNHG